MKSTKGNSAEFKAIEKLAMDKTNWKNRLEAIHKMRRIMDKRVEKIIIDMALHDKVFAVKKGKFNSWIREIYGDIPKKDDE